jgi:hypothetical protein
VIVVGGTYEEICLNPPRPSPDDPVLMGSGMRAVLALRGVAPEIELRSAIHASARVEAEATLGAFGLRGVWIDRSEPIRFAYFTPVSPPTIDGRLARADTIEVRDDTVAVFGMLECEAPRITAGTLVFDPQRPKDAAPPDLSSFQTDRLAIVANRFEISNLGGNPDPNIAAQAVLKRYGAAVVVVKMGARGALVVTSDGATWVGARFTASVYPIGSGDVFTAAFAWALGERRDDPVEAARTASLAAAQWCGNGGSASPFQPESEYQELPTRAQVPRVYVAGPFFNIAQRWLIDVVRAGLQDIGASTFSPLHDVGRGGKEVAQKDLAGLDECQSVLAILDGSDPGTFFELGFATGKWPIVGYAEIVDTEGWKMIAGTEAEISDDLSTALYHVVWQALETLPA